MVFCGLYGTIFTLLKKGCHLFGPPGYIVYVRCD